METKGSPVRKGALLSLPMSVLLLGFFFMPWLKLSCYPAGLAGAPVNGAIVNLPNPLPEAKVVARATGWEIARGEITPEDEFRDAKTQMPKDQPVPKTRSWVYLGLALPVALVIVGAMGIMGNISPGRAGKIMLLLGLVGVGTMLAALSIDYVDDVFDAARDEMAKANPGGPPPMFRASMEKSNEEAQGTIKKALKTEASGYLWACLALYGLTAGVGLVTLNAPEEACTEAEFVRESVPFEHDTFTPGPGPQFNRSAPAEHAPGELPSFGPDITPLRPAPNSPTSSPSDGE